MPQRAVRAGLSAAELAMFAELGPKAKKTSRRDLASVLAQRQPGATTVAGTMAIAHMAGIRVFVTGGLGTAQAQRALPRANAARRRAHGPSRCVDAAAGGVHRGGEHSMDISADLTELGRTPVAVVSAGVKVRRLPRRDEAHSAARPDTDFHVLPLLYAALAAQSILDIGRTLEYLETQGVPVATLGPTADFPAFYTRKSGFYSPLQVATAAEAAALLLHHFQLPSPTGAVLGRHPRAGIRMRRYMPLRPRAGYPENARHSGPDPGRGRGAQVRLATLAKNVRALAERIICVSAAARNGMRMHSVENAIRAALVEAEQRQIRGAAVTPFVLQAVNVLTQGAALRANIALVRNNARRGSEVAKALATLSTARDDAPANISVRAGAVPTAPHAPPLQHLPQ